LITNISIAITNYIVSHANSTSLHDDQCLIVLMLTGWAVNKWRDVSDIPSVLPTNTYVNLSKFGQPWGLYPFRDWWTIYTV